MEAQDESGHVHNYADAHEGEYTKARLESNVRRIGGVGSRERPDEKLEERMDDGEFRHCVAAGRRALT